MRRQQAILFDLGGTLLYPDFPFVAEQLRLRGQEIHLDPFLHALSVASNRMDAYMQLHASNDATRVPVYITYLLEALEVRTGIAGLVNDIIMARHRTVNFWNYLLAGTLPLLGRLRERYRLAMISNSDGRAEAKAAQYGISPYLEFVMDSHLVGLEKPDPRIFHLACRQLGLPPADCVYVGDIYSIDVLGARAAGLQPVLIDRTGTPREDCRVIRSIFELDNP
ncbi:MAG: HAD family hydrolase [Cytophagales bacterium]|nr:HAD family hydrolase [Cytophagales bacterium]